MKAADDQRVVGERFDLSQRRRVDVPGKCVAEAAVLAVGFDLRLFDTKAIERWADRWITELDEPSDLLLDLSILGDRNPVDIERTLRQVAMNYQHVVEAEIGLVGLLYERRVRSLRSLIGSLYEFVLKDRVDDSIAATIYHLDDGLDLAEQGYFGTVEEVEVEFATFVAPFSSKLRSDFPDLLRLALQ